MSPGVAGMNRDIAPHLISLTESRRAQDAVVDDRMLRQIMGWEYDGSVADYDIDAELQGVIRNRYLLADKILSLTTGAGRVAVHNPSSAATQIDGGLFGGVTYLPRAVYGDQVVLVDPTGAMPMLLHSGGEFATQNIGALGMAGSVVTAGGTFTRTPQPGDYVSIQIDGGPGAVPSVTTFHRILNVDAGNKRLSLEGLFLADGETNTYLGSGGNPIHLGFGFAFPCVPVYEAGTVTIANDAINARSQDVTGVGVTWSGGDWGNVYPSLLFGDALLVKPAGAKAEVSSIYGNATPSTMLTGSSAQTDPVAYQILRRCPFTEVAAHRFSLFGTGVKQAPNTVFAGPQGWNSCLPPGYVPPINPAAVYESDNPDDFTLFPIVVPSPYDGDGNVALLSSPEGLRVLKGKSSHTIFGDYPNFSQRPWLPGIGCIDMRSAQTLSFGLVFASREGVFLESNGQVENLAEGRERRGGIANDWRALVAGFSPEDGDTCAVGEDRGRMLVSLFTDGGATHVTYAYERETGGWTSEVTCHRARFFFKSDIPGEAPRLLWVGPDNASRVMDSVPALRLTGTAKNADATSPSLEYESGTALGEAAGLEGEVTLGDANFHANVLDEGADGATSVTLSVVHGGGVRQGDVNETKTLAPIESDQTDRIDRHERRVNRSGRHLQVVLAVDPVGSDLSTTKVAIAEVTLELFDAGVGT